MKSTTKNEMVDTKLLLICVAVSLLSHPCINSVSPEIDVNKGVGATFMSLSHELLKKIFSVIFPCQKPLFIDLTKAINTIIFDLDVPFLCFP